MIVILQSYTRCGKDTVKELLIQHGFQPLTIADPLKIFMSDLLHEDLETINNLKNNNTPIKLFNHTTTVRDLIITLAKSIKSFNPTFFIDNIINQVHNNNYVISDLRFEIEQHTVYNELHNITQIFIDSDLNSCTITSADQEVNNLYKDITLHYRNGNTNNIKLNFLLNLIFDNTISISLFKVYVVIDDIFIDILTFLKTNHDSKIDLITFFLKDDVLHINPLFTLHALYTFLDDNIIHINTINNTYQLT